MSLFYTLTEYVLYFHTIIDEITVKRLNTQFFIDSFLTYIIISTMTEALEIS